MSGPVANNIFRSSGVVVAAAGGLSWQPVVTASTLSASAGNGYWINTTSNACTITLPGSAEAGDQIIFVDYARTWGTNKIVIDSNGLNFQGEDDTYTVDYDTSGQALNLVYSGATIGWTPSSDIVNALEPAVPPTQKAIFGFGSPSYTNLVASNGTVASNVTSVGTTRYGPAGANYGGDKAIFFGGAKISDNAETGITNLVNNSGVVGNDVAIAAGVRTVASVAGSTYGGDKAIVYGGYGSTTNNKYNLINNVGVVAADATGAPTGRSGTAGSKFGSAGKAIFAYGTANINISFIVTDQGVPGSDVTGVGTARKYLACSSFGGDRCVFAYGSNDDVLAVSNKVSNTGVVASDTGAVGTGRFSLAGSGYGGDKGIFAYGKFSNGAVTNATNLVSNTGVVAADTTAVGTARQNGTAAGFSFSA
jgi:hypothetical protein